MTYACPTDESDAQRAKVLQEPGLIVIDRIVLMTADLSAVLDEQRGRVDVDHADFSIRELVRMVEDNELVMAPEYQRQFRWDEKRESELIESILLGLPIPPIFVATNADGTWDLVDGLQRISAIIHFSSNPDKFPNHLKKDASLKLDKSLSKLEAFGDLGYEDLPRNIQLLFDRRLLRVTALSDKSQLDVRFDLFERLNRGGITLSPQEVRACIYRGPLNDLIEEVAVYLRDSKLLKLKRGNLDDGTYEEQVLKYFAYLYGRDNFTHLVGEFLNEFMKDNRQAPQVSEWREAAIDAILDLERIFNKNAVVKPGARTTSLNQFEALMVAVSEIRQAGAVPSGNASEIVSDDELTKFSTGSTNTPTALRNRIRRASELLTSSK